MDVLDSSPGLRIMNRIDQGSLHLTMAVTLGVAIAGRYPWDRVRGKISALVVAVLYLWLLGIERELLLWIRFAVAKRKRSLTV